MDDFRALTCLGCGAELVELPVAHFQAGRRSTTLELLCPTHGCEHHARPDGHVGSVRRVGGSPALPAQRRSGEPEPA